MAITFDYAKLTAEREAELAKQPAEKLNAPMDPDPDKGVAKIAELMTALPEEEREAAVRGMIASMLTG